MSRRLPSTGGLPATPEEATIGTENEDWTESNEKRKRCMVSDMDAQKGEGQQTNCHESKNEQNDQVHSYNKLFWDTA